MKNELILRIKRFALYCWRFCFKVPKPEGFNAFFNQLIRSSSSVGTNYRALQRAKSTAGFINKLKIVEEGADKSVYWLEIFEETLPKNTIGIYKLKKQGKELLAITWLQLTQPKEIRNLVNF